MIMIFHCRLEDDYWIGLNDMENGSQFWEDGSAMNWENWKAGYPDNTNDECVTTDGEWKDRPCTDKNMVLCQRDPMPGTGNPPSHIDILCLSAFPSIPIPLPRSNLAYKHIPVCLTLIVYSINAGDIIMTSMGF